MYKFKPGARTTIWVSFVCDKNPTTWTLQLLVHFKFPQQLVWARLKSETWNSMGVYHVAGRASKPVIPAACLPGYALAGNWVGSRGTKTPTGTQTWWAWIPHQNRFHSYTCKDPPKLVSSFKSENICKKGGKAVLWRFSYRTEICRYKWTVK